MSCLIFQCSFHWKFLPIFHGTDILVHHPAIFQPHIITRCKCRFIYQSIIINYLRAPASEIFYEFLKFFRALTWQNTCQYVLKWLKQHNQKMRWGEKNQIKHHLLVPLSWSSCLCTFQQTVSWEGNFLFKASSTRVSRHKVISTND